MSHWCLCKIEDADFRIESMTTTKLLCKCEMQQRKSFWAGVTHWDETMRDHKKTVLRVQSNWNSLGFFSPIRCDLSISFILYVLTFANQKEAKKQRTEILICPPLSAHLPLGKYVPRFEKFLMQNSQRKCLGRINELIHYIRYASAK